MNTLGETANGAVDTISNATNAPSRTPGGRDVIRELQERLKVVSHCPVKVFVASYIPRYWYPYRLQHAADARPWVKEESLEVIMDSAILEEEIGNQEVLDKAHDLHADYVIPNDSLDDQAATTTAVREFVDLYEDHECTSTPMIPLQPPYDRHYRELDEFSHYVLGGIATASPVEQLQEIRRFREEAGRYVYAHGLGLGASMKMIRALRGDPTLLDSFDLSTTEQVVANEKLPDKTWINRDFRYPTGDESSTVRAAYASAVVLQLNYMLGPFCSDDELESDSEQATLAAADGGVPRDD